MGTTNQVNGSTPEIILYTNHLCPWAYRVHVALAELHLPFTEHIIDLDVPREPSYLKINPRGLVPTLVYDGEIIPESAIVTQFLADAHPSQLLKSSTEHGGALQRARVNFFVDTFIHKVNPHLFAGIRAISDQDRLESGVKLVEAVVKELEPALQGAAPFLGGADKLTLAEVNTASFVLRILSFSKHGLLAPKLVEDLEAKAPNFFKWANAVIAENSVTHVWDEQIVVARTKSKLARSAGQK